MSEKRSGRGEGGPERVSPWEWVLAAGSALVVLGTIGYLGYLAVSEPNTPPQVSVVADTIVESPHGFVVEFRAENLGRSTAAALVIEGELRADTGVVETATATLDYLPGLARRSGGLFFQHDPRDYTLQIRPKAYDHP